MNDLRKLKRGENEAFEAFYKKHSKTVFYTAYSILKDDGLAEQIMQDAFVKFYLSLRELDEEKNPIGLVCTIAKNLAVNQYNKRKIEISVDDEKLKRVAADDDFNKIEITYVAAQVLNEREFRVLMMITDRYRRREISKIMDVPLPTVSWLYKEALRKLQNALEET